VDAAAVPELQAAGCATISPQGSTRFWSGIVAGTPVPWNQNAESRSVQRARRAGDARRMNRKCVPASSDVHHENITNGFFGYFVPIVYGDLA
jgi:hypothetical protein